MNPKDNFVKRCGILAKTILFDDLELELDPRTFEVGGAWSKDRKAHDVEGSVRFFYEKMLTWKEDLWVSR